MKTKIVYVVVCDSNHNYLEQAAVSAYSVKRYNPKAEILLLVDDRTFAEINNGRTLIKKYVSDIVEVFVPKEYDNKLRSRYIKTTVRENVQGDFLFVDTDTVITGNLDEIDSCPNDVAAVLDMHLPLNQTPYLEEVKFQASKMVWNLTSKDYTYYNSGVMYVKDTPTAHKLYKQWHENWLLKAKNGLYTDQPALAFANNQCGHVIGELSGKWNCQLLVNGLPFLSEALIIHYFSSGINKKMKQSPYIFADDHLLEKVKQHQDFTKDLIEAIESPKCKAFPLGKTILVGGEDFDVFRSDVVKFIYSRYYYYPKMYSVIKYFVDIYYWLKRMKSK